MGPYLPPQDLARTVADRLLVIEHRGTPAVRLVPLQDDQGRPWRDQLEDSRVEDRVIPPAEPNLPACLTIYLKHRVLEQHDWFLQKRDDHAKRDERIERWAKGFLVGAIVLAAMHLVFHLSHDSSRLSVLVGIIAIVLPPIAMILVALQALYESRRLSRSYEEQADLLHSLVREFTSLEEDIRAAAELGLEDEDSVLGALDFQFKRLVLRTEDVIVHELRQWGLVIGSAGEQHGL